ncbi:FG-GAP repeat domain-containing protein [Actinokineospora cianjurensis]|uniref:FG-GAP repeat domain-containing protein n=1 Tax=Actinokineospora cianjurensis TaxID=585224 RepID=UPI003CCC6F09
MLPSPTARTAVGLSREPDPLGADTLVPRPNRLYRNRCRAGPGAGALRRNDPHAGRAPRPPRTPGCRGIAHLWDEDRPARAQLRPRGAPGTCRARTTRTDSCSPTCGAPTLPGRLDLVHIGPDGTLRVRCNGNGLTTRPWTNEVVVGTGFDDPTRVHFADLSGDGRAELVHHERAATTATASSRCRGPVSW